MTKFKRALAFDFGLKRIGVAVGQAITRSARPLTTIKATAGTPNWNDVDKLIREWEPDILIVGNPLNMDGTEQAITKAAKTFAGSLAARYPIPVTQFDERLTTIEARARIFEQGGYSALQKSEVDAQAAAVILESWILDNL